MVGSIVCGQMLGFTVNAVFSVVGQIREGRKMGAIGCVLLGFANVACGLFNQGFLAPLNWMVAGVMFTTALFLWRD